MGCTVDDNGFVKFTKTTEVIDGLSDEQFEEEMQELN